MLSTMLAFVLASPTMPPLMPQTLPPAVEPTPVAAVEMAPMTKLRKLHLVRPDLIPYPVATETYC